MGAARRMKRVLPLNISQRVSDFLQQAKSHEAFDIPIFPLKAVLFPAGKLPVKVFEPRYMDMASACLRNNTRFGICLITEGKESGKPARHADTGCSAEIAEWEMDQPGVLHIQAVGIQRFHVETSHVEKNGLIMARAVPITPEPPHPLPASHQACATLLRRLIEHLGENRFTSPLNFDDAAWVGYRLAELLPLKLSVRQNMLEMNDSEVRIEILHSFLARQGLLG